MSRIDKKAKTLAGTSSSKGVRAKTARVKTGNLISRLMSDETLKALIMILPVGISIIDDKRKVTDINPALERILRVSKEELLMEKYTTRRYLRGDGSPMPPEEFASFRAVEEKREIYDVEIGVVCEDETVIWTSVSAAPLPGSGAVVITTDITERKHLEQKFRRLLESAPDAMILINRDGMIVLVNAQAEKIFGRQRSDMLDQPVDSLLPKRFRSQHKNHRNAFFSNPRARAMGAGLELYALRNDGSEFPVEISLSPIETMEGTLTIVAIRDISERLKAAEKLTESEERFYSAFEYSAIGMALVAPDGHWLRVNPALCDLTGYTQDELLKTTFQAITYPDDVGIDLPYTQSLLAGEIKTFHMEKRYFHASGHIVWVLLNVSLVRDHQQKPLYFVSQIEDITERKMADQALHESQSNLLAAQQLAHIGSWYVEIATDKHLWSDETYRIFGIPIGETISSKIFWELLHPEDVEYAKKAWIEALHQKPYNVQYRIIVGGKIKWLRVQSQLEFNSEGRAIHAIGTVQDITERRLAEQKIQRQLDRLTALGEIDRAITSTFDIKLSLMIILTQVTSQLGVDATDILLFDPTSKMLEYAVGRGFRSKTIEQFLVQLGQGYAGQAALEQKTIFIPHLKAQENWDEDLKSRQLLAENFISYCAVPLSTKGQIKGVLEIYHRSELIPDEDWFEFLQVLAKQGAIAIDNATLFDNLQRSNFELKIAYDATIEGWSRALDLRDKETEGHTQRVTEMTIDLARAFGFSGEKLVHIRWGALLHDIGKMGIPDRILLKPGTLTEEEWVLMKMHPTFAHEMLSPIRYLQPALDIPYCHHEKWDGSGYPRGLKGDQIPLSARIFAVVDILDAVRSDRPYRAAWSEEKAQEYIRSLAGTHLDPDVTKACLESGILTHQKSG